ncbi:hypothetical protein, partial [Gordonia alkanivorans]|uniref:hypothetical protein n=1 Tax=Gordonia alkanivorans TaxID=84096 RepID=UPI00244A83AA
MRVIAAVDGRPEPVFRARAALARDEDASIHRPTHEELADRGHFRRRNGIPRTRRPRGGRGVG